MTASLFASVAADAHTAGMPAVSRSYSHEYGMQQVRVLPGAYYTTSAEDEMIVTILGSCVAACVRNPRTGYGGMNHFMLPQSDNSNWGGTNSAMRYGNFAMEALINDVLKTGCARSELEIKLFGGANLYNGPSMVGTQNLEFALSYLRTEGLPLNSHDLGGPRGRRIHYFPATGKVKRLLLKPTTDQRLIRSEQDYIQSLQQQPIEGDVDLFE